MTGAPGVFFFFFWRILCEKETSDNCLYEVGNHRDEMLSDQSLKVINSLQITDVELEHREP